MPQLFISLVASKNGCQDFHLGYHHPDALLSFCFSHLRTRWWLPNPTVLSHERLSPLFSHGCMQVLDWFKRFHVQLVCREKQYPEEILSKWKLGGVPAKNLPFLTRQVVTPAHGRSHSWTSPPLIFSKQYSYITIYLGSNFSNFVQ